MTFASRYPLNIPGRFYVDDQCTDCDLCRECAPDNIRRDDRFGHYYVYKQPVNEEEVEAVMEGVEGCPTEAVRDDGDQFDWATEPMVDWNAVMERFDRDVRFELSVPVIPYEETLREEQRMEEKTSARDSPQGPSRWWQRIFRSR